MVTIVTCDTTTHIPSAIKEDMQTYLLFMGGEHIQSVNNNCNEESPVQCGFMYNLHGAATYLSFEGPDSLCDVNGEFNMDRYIDVIENFETTTEVINGNIYSISTCASWEGIETKVFECIYDFDNAKGLPQSIYDAYDYLCKHLTLPKERMLEIFSLLTCAVHHLDDEILFTAKQGTMGANFDVEKALAHDLKYNS